MTGSITSSWAQANRQYITNAVAQVHWALDSYIALQNNQENTSAPPPEYSAANVNPPPPLEQLCHIFHLSPFERSILVLGVGMAIHPNFSALCANANRHSEMPYPTFNLAREVFPASQWSAFTPQSPLRRWQLLTVGNRNVVTLSPFQIDESILHYIMGEPYQDHQLAKLMQPLSVEADNHLPLQPSHQEICDKIIALWEPLQATVEGQGAEENFQVSTLYSPLPIIQLCGLQIEAKEEIASAISRQLKLPLKRISVHRLPINSDELHQFIQRWERQAILTGSILLLDCEELNPTESLFYRVIVQIIEQINSPLIIASFARITSDRRTPITFEVPQLNYQEQRAIWQFYVDKLDLKVNGYILDDLVTQFNLSRDAIAMTCLSIKSLNLPEEAPPETNETIDKVVEETNAKTKSRRRKKIEQDPPPPPPPIILKPSKSLSQIHTKFKESCTFMAQNQMNEFATLIKSNATWEQLELAEKENNQIVDMIDRVRHRFQVYYEQGMAQKIGKGLRISALFTGKPGTGKTLAAEVIANIIGLDLYRIDLSAVQSKYIGESEKNLRKIFQAASAGGVILLFDEADALFGKRTEVKDSHDRYANVGINYLLQMMEDYRGLSILTTNMKDALDGAFLRRLTFVVDFSLPSFPIRIKIWKYLLESIETKGVDFYELAKLDVAGGNIKNIVLGAIFLATAAGEAVMMKHLSRATKAEYVKIGKFITTVDIRGWEDKERA